MSDFRDNFRKVTPYVPGEQPKTSNVIKLNTNENPYPPSPEVMKAVNSAGELRLYPDPTASVLVSAIADYHGVGNDQVFVGVGSDDVLSMSFLTFFNSGKPVLFPDITYSFYDVWAELYQIPYVTPALDSDFRIRPEDYYRENGGVIFPNPNAPTGLDVSLDFIRDILDHNRDCVVIVDEAYVDFGAETALPLIKEYDNLLVVRTYSKSRSLAGLRIGYAVGSPVLIKALNDVKQSFNSYTINQLSLVMGAASIADDDYFRDRVKKIIETRENFKKDISNLGFEFPDSKANFVFIHHPKFRASDIFARARKAGIYVRYFDKPVIDDYLRVTIGTDEQMKAFTDFLKREILS